MPRNKTAGAAIRMRLTLSVVNPGSVKLPAPTSQAICGANNSTSNTTTSKTRVAALSTILRTRQSSSRRSSSA